MATYKQTDQGKSTAPNIGKPGCAECSRPGEDNSRHVAMAIVAIGALAVVAGLLNVKVSAGR